MTDCTCPVCNGTGRRAVPEDEERFCHQRASYDAATHTLTCNNCGGQTMSGKATGRTLARPDSTPCKHEYDSRTIGRCYTQYTCKHCGYYFSIDSGD